VVFAARMADGVSALRAKNVSTSQHVRKMRAGLSTNGATQSSPEDTAFTTPVARVRRTATAFAGPSEGRRRGDPAATAELDRIWG